MSTRAMYTFLGDKTGRGKREHFHVYKHHDGYPINASGCSGGVIWIKKAMDFAWALPRYEASDFAAAFVAANKESGESIRKRELAMYRRIFRNSKKAGEDTSFEERKIEELMDRSKPISRKGGGVYLMESGHDWREVAALDLEYRYEVEQDRDAATDLTVRAYRINYDGEWDSKFDKNLYKQDLLFTTGLSHADVQAKLRQVQDAVA